MTLAALGAISLPAIAQDNGEGSDEMLPGEVNMQSSMQTTEQFGRGHRSNQGIRQSIQRSNNPDLNTANMQEGFQGSFQEGRRNRNKQRLQQKIFWNKK